MLSSKCSNRLLPLLKQALHNCKEEERLLEEQLRQCCRLLTYWKTDTCETLNADDPVGQPQAEVSQPSAEEVQEVELLNKALEKALKVRGTCGTESPKVLPIMKEAPPCSSTKEKTEKPLNKLSNTGAKPVAYHLKAPYKTMQEKRRVRGAAKALSENRTALSTHLKQTTLEKGNTGKEKVAEHWETSARTAHASLKPNSPPSTVPNGDSPQQIKQQKAFTLQDKGPTLKLPVEYQQLYMRNTRVWEKYYEIQDHLPASRPSFIQRLQTTFIPESPELSLSEIEDQAVHMQKAIRSLEKRINTANEWEGAGPTHWQQYGSLLLLEALQEEVAKSYFELQKLEQVAEQYKRWSEKLFMNAACPEVTVCSSSYRTAPPVLIYSHPDELCELTASQLRVLELQQKIYLQKVQSEELLAEADVRCPSSTSSYLLVRALYTQLCEGGDLFPVLVQDDG